MPCLFPNLQRLELGPEHLPFVSMFLAPHLDDVILAPDETNVEDPEVMAAISRLPEQSPYVSELNMCAFAPSRLFNDMMANLYPRLENLTSFTMCLVSISAADLVSLASLPRLQFIRVTLAGRQDPSKAFSNRLRSMRFFRALRHLDITLFSYKHAVRLLHYVRSPNLTVLQLHSRQIPTLAQVEKVIGVLTSPRMHRLRQFRFSTQAHSPAAIADRTLTIATLRPLFVLPLEVLDTNGFYIDVDDEDLNAMATAWPGMEELWLSAYTGWGEHHLPRATIRGLLPFFRHCPNIKYIGYCMRTDVLGPSSGSWLYSRPGDGVVTENSIVLHVVDSPVYNVTEVASFLSDVCPNIRGIRCLWGDTKMVVPEDEDEDEDEAQEMHRSWGLVMKYVPHFVTVRVQERGG